MELMKGYKQTELGIFPVDWEIISIDQIFTFYSTSNYSKAQMSFDGEVGCIHYGLIHAIPNTFYNVQNGIKYFINQEQAKYETIKNGDIVMVDASEDLEGVNKSVELSGIENGKYIAGLHTFLLRDTNLLLANNFRGAILNSTIIKNQLLRLAVGMKVFGVSKPQLKTILIPLPPFSEQTAIATALSNIDELISQTEKLIDKKKAIKQGVMQELLKPKNGWVTKKLGNIAKFQKGKGLPKSHINEYGKFKCIHYGELFTKYKEAITKILSYTDENDNCFYSQFNDVLMPTSDVTPNGLATASCLKEDGIILGGDVLVIRIAPNILDGIFLSYYISQNREKIMKLVSGSTVYHLYGSDMKDFEVSFPDITTQLEIIRVISDLDSEINILEIKFNKLKHQKQGMMQALLTGKIRLL